MSVYWVFSEKNERVTAQTARWNDVADAEFEKFGTTRQALTDVQYGFVGEIITPWDPGYDKARRLSNPKFDDYPSIILMCACENDAVLALNLAWGGGWGGAQGVDDSVLPQKYYIDYVRIYQIGKE